MVEEYNEIESSIDKSNIKCGGNSRIGKNIRENSDKDEKLKKIPKLAHEDTSFVKNSNLNRTCPYLGTINRHLLNFDFEKLCSVSLTNLHIYCCLVCGKYFQGKNEFS